MRSTILFPSIICQRYALFLPAMLSVVLLATLYTPAHAEEKLSWETLTSPSESDIVLKMAVTGDGTLFAYAQFAGLLRSDDNGQSWKPVPIEHQYISDLLAMGTTLYCVTEHGAYSTTDKGETWQEIGQGDNQWPATLFISTTGIFIGSQQKGVFHSTDGGKTWLQALDGAEVRRIVETPNGTLYAAVVYPAEFGSPDLIADTSGVYRSTDGGTTWTRTGLIDKLIGTLVSHSTILLAGTQELEGRGRVFRSEDGGATWSSTTLQDITSSLLALPDGSFAGSAVNSGVYRSMDGGRTWVSSNGGLSDPRIMGMARHHDGYLFAFDVFGKLYRSTSPIATDVRAKPSPTVSVRLAPHPVADDAVFVITTTGQDYIRLELFDKHGRTIAVPAEGLFAPAEHHIHFSVRDLATGVYLYRLKTLSSVLSGSFSIVR